jgi:hypothetical protein
MTWRCRWCGCSLGQSADKRRAFCSRQCHAAHFASRCLVCERPFERRSPRQQLCSNVRCHAAMKRHPEHFPAAAAPVAKPVRASGFVASLRRADEYERGAF